MLERKEIIAGWHSDYPARVRGCVCLKMCVCACVYEKKEEYVNVFKEAFKRCGNANGSSCVRFVRIPDLFPVLPLLFPLYVLAG